MVGLHAHGFGAQLVLLRILLVVGFFVILSPLVESVPLGCDEDSHACSTWAGQAQNIVLKLLAILVPREWAFFGSPAPSDDDDEPDEGPAVQSIPENGPCNDLRCWIHAIINFCFDGLTAATTDPVSWWMGVWEQCQELAISSIPFVTFVIGLFVTVMMANAVAWTWQQGALLVKLLWIVLVLIFQMPICKLLWSIVKGIFMTWLEVSGVKKAVTKQTKNAVKALATIAEEADEDETAQEGQDNESTAATSAEKAEKSVSGDLQHDAQSSVTVIAGPSSPYNPGDTLSFSPKPVNAVNFTAMDSQSAPMIPAARDPYLVMLLEKFIDRVVGKSAKKAKDSKTEKGLYCTFCHKSNHTADTCWAKADAEGRPRPNFRGSKALAADPVKGNTVSGAGSAVQECSAVRASMPCTLLHAPCWLNGQRVSKCLIDTGSEVNLMSLREATRRSIPFAPGGVQAIKGFSGDITSVMGIAMCNMGFFPDVDTTQVEFLVVKNLSDGPIIGMPTLSAFGLGVDCVRPGLFQVSTGKVLTCSAVNRGRKN